MKQLRYLLSVLALLGVTACTGAQHHVSVSEQESPVIAVDTLYSGAQCGRFVSGVSVRLIKDAAQLASFYQPLGLAQGEVDFDQSIVVMIEMGERPTLGYHLELAQQEAKLIDGGVELVLNWHEPPSGMMAGQMMTSPCLLLKLDKGQYKNIWIVDAQKQRRTVLHMAD